MQLIVRRVKCVCTGGHEFEFEGDLFWKKPLSKQWYIQICVKCGAYEYNVFGNGIKDPVETYLGPDKRMYYYWKINEHHSTIR